MNTVMNTVMNTIMNTVMNTIMNTVMDTTGSFIIPVAKYLVIAPRFLVLVPFHAYCRLTRYGPFDNICLLSILMIFQRPHRHAEK